MRDGVIVIDAQRRFIMNDRFVEVVVFEQQISDIRDGGHELRIGGERIDEGVDRRPPIARPDIRDPAFVVYRRPVGIPGRERERRIEVSKRLGDASALERGDAGRHRRGRRTTPSKSPQAREE